MSQVPPCKGPQPSQDTIHVQPRSMASNSQIQTDCIVSIPYLVFILRSYLLPLILQLRALSWWAPFQDSSRVSPCHWSPTRAGASLLSLCMGCALCLFEVFLPWCCRLWTNLLVFQGVKDGHGRKEAWSHHIRLFHRNYIPIKSSGVLHLPLGRRCFWSLPLISRHASLIRLSCWWSQSTPHSSYLFPSLFDWTIYYLIV